MDYASEVISNVAASPSLIGYVDSSQLNGAVKTVHKAEYALGKLQKNAGLQQQSGIFLVTAHPVAMTSEFTNY